MILDVLRSRIRTSLQLFNVQMTQTFFPLHVKKGLEEEIGEELPKNFTLLGVKIEWQDEGKG
jgi:hypothetical protein